MTFLQDIYKAAFGSTEKINMVQKDTLVVRMFLSSKQGWALSVKKIDYSKKINY